MSEVECDVYVVLLIFFFQAEDGIRDLVRSRGLGDVYKRQVKQQDKPVNVGNILQIIDTVIKKEAAWQRHKQTKWGNPLSQC